jgi:hypothetical protein
MPTIKKYIIKPDNVKNPFQMRATSPLAVETPTEDLVMIEAPDTPSYVAPETSDSGVRPSSFGAFGELTIDPLAEKSEEEKEKDKFKLTKQNTKSLSSPNITDISNKRMPERGSAATYRDPDSPLNYSPVNPFSPREQGVIGNIYNPSGNDISQFEDTQLRGKDLANVRLGGAQMEPIVVDPKGNPVNLNPNTLNEPPIPTEADTTMNDLQMGNEPMGAVFGENLPGALNPRQQRKADRRSRRADRRANRQGGFKNFVRQAGM